VPGLTKAQKEAICHKDGPMMVLAGPGSGKTMVITRRVLHLMKHDRVPPEKILVITFTRAAAAEMKERFLGLAGVHLPVAFGTFHSVFFTILKHAYHFRSDNILPEHKKYELLREIIYDQHLEMMMKEFLRSRSGVQSGHRGHDAVFGVLCTAVGCGDDVFGHFIRQCGTPSWESVMDFL
jgi:DNA helicase-2/ATP-dependent DNA helicase PcrA